MVAALTISPQQIGSPLGNLTLSGTPQEVSMVATNRINADVQAIAIDSTGAAVAFRYRTTQTGAVTVVPAGAGVTLPDYKTQSWWFEEDPSSAAPTLYFTCVG